MFFLCRNEEYTCYVDQFVVKDLFDKTHLLTNAAKIQSLYVIRHVIDRMTIENIPRSQALDLSMQLKSIYPHTSVPETPDATEIRRREKGKKKKKEHQGDDSDPQAEPKAEPKNNFATALLKQNFNESVFLAKALNNNDEEDKLRVLTIRSCVTNGKFDNTIR